MKGLVEVVARALVDDPTPVDLAAAAAKQNCKVTLEILEPERPRRVDDPPSAGAGGEAPADNASPEPEPSEAAS